MNRTLFNAEGYNMRPQVDFYATHILQTPMPLVDSADVGTPPLAGVIYERPLLALVKNTRELWRKYVQPNLSKFT